jgi:hypothetical protein
MGQRANNGGRNAQLDQKKTRAAGRLKEKSPEREAIRDQFDEKPAKGATGGASGRGKTNRKASPLSRGGGGGGANQSMDHAAPMDTPRSSRRARKGGT